MDLDLLGGVRCILSKLMTVVVLIESDAERSICVVSIVSSTAGRDSNGIG